MAMYYEARSETPPDDEAIIVNTTIPDVAKEEENTNNNATAVDNSSITSNTAAAAANSNLVFLSGGSFASSNIGHDKEGNPVHNVFHYQHGAESTLARAIGNRQAVKGTGKFSSSINFLCQQLAKGPVSDSGIKKMDVGLSQALQHESKTTTTTTSSAPLRDSLFKISESLIEVGNLLEGIEQASTKLAISKARREMLSEQHSLFLRFATDSGLFAQNNTSDPNNHNDPHNNLAVASARR